MIAYDILKTFSLFLHDNTWLNPRLKVNRRKYLWLESYPMKISAVKKVTTHKIRSFRGYENKPWENMWDRGFVRD